MLTEHYYFIYRKVCRPGSTPNSEVTQQQPVATVCLVQGDDGRVARGIALCSDTEAFSRHEGRKDARKRAIRAYYTKKDNSKHTDPIRQDCGDDTPFSVYLWLDICRDPQDAVRRDWISQEMADRIPVQDYLIKSCANVHLTKFEDTLLKWHPADQQAPF